MIVLVLIKEAGRLDMENCMYISMVNDYPPLGPCYSGTLKKKVPSFQFPLLITFFQVKFLIFYAIFRVGVCWFQKHTYMSNVYILKKNSGFLPRPMLGQPHFLTIIV